MALTIILTLLSIAVGGVITFLVARSYYESASGDLECEAGELRRETNNLQQLTKKLMLMMDDAGLIKVEWDKEGNPIRIVELSGTISGSSSMTARPTVIRSKEQDNDSEGA